MHNSRGAKFEMNSAISTALVKAKFYNKMILKEKTDQHKILRAT